MFSLVTCNSDYTFVCSCGLCIRLCVYDIYDNRVWYFVAYCYVSWCSAETVGAAECHWTVVSELYSLTDSANVVHQRHWSWAARSTVCSSGYQSTVADGFWLHRCSADVGDGSLWKVNHHCFWMVVHQVLCLLFLCALSLWITACLSHFVLLLTTWRGRADDPQTPVGWEDYCNISFTSKCLPYKFA